MKNFMSIVLGRKEGFFPIISIAFFFTGTFFFILASPLMNAAFSRFSNVFSAFAGIYYGLWFVTCQNNESIKNIICEAFRLVIFLLILCMSLNFCINTILDYNGINPIIGTFLASIGIYFSFLYLVSKFTDIFRAVKSIFFLFKAKLFNSDHPATTKLKAFIENTTALLVSIAGLGVAIMAIIQPLIDFFTS